MMMTNSENMLMRIQKLMDDNYLTDTDQFTEILSMTHTLTPLFVLMDLSFHQSKPHQSPL